MRLTEEREPHFSDKYGGLDAKIAMIQRRKTSESCRSLFRHRDTPPSQ